MKKLYGVITAMTTPFDEQGKLDLEAMRAQTEFLIERRKLPLTPAEPTGEMFLCSEEERKAIAEPVVKTAAGRVTVFVHVGAMTQEETIRLRRHAEAIGADGIGVV